MQEISNLHELKKKQYRLYVFIMLALLLVMTAYTIFWCASFSNTYGTFEKTLAKSIELYDSDREVSGYALEYFDGVNNVTIQNTSSNLANKDNVGEEFWIYYDTENPSSVIKNLDVGRIVLPIITSVYGVACIILTTLFIRTFYTKHSTMQSDDKRLDKAKKRRRENMYRINVTILKNKGTSYKKIAKKNVNTD